MILGLVLLGETAHVSRLKRAWSRPLRAWREHHAGMIMSPALSCAPLFFSPSGRLRTLFPLPRACW